eukprot:360363-Chlamydomonas_euryale.AAC.9
MRHPQQVRRKAQSKACRGGSDNSCAVINGYATTSREFVSTQRMNTVLTAQRDSNKNNSEGVLVATTFGKQNIPRKAAVVKKRTALPKARCHQGRVATKGGIPSPFQTCALAHDPHTRTHNTHNTHNTHTQHTHTLLVTLCTGFSGRKETNDNWAQ